MVAREVKIIRQKITIPRSGQSLVEFAIVLPLLVLILIGIFDLGRAFYSLITITNAAREGARYATFYPNNITGIQNIAVGEASGSGINIIGTNVTRTCPTGSCTSGNPVLVTVQYQYNFILNFFVPNGVTFTRSVQMMIQ